MAISDVQQALINVGTISKDDVATVSYFPAGSTITSDGSTTVAATDEVTGQASWLGSRSFSGFKDIEIQPVAGDTTGTLIDFSLVTNTGVANFTVGTIVAYDATNVVFLDTDTYYMIASTPGALSSNDASLFPITDFDTTGSYAAPPPVCFVEGTRIRTERGEIAVEDLVEGDQVHVRDGGTTATRPVTWIGQREVNLASHPDPFEAQPIRIRRDAFAAGVPCRDLLMSPDHAVFVNGALIPDGVLIPARLLFNGASIVRESRLTKVRYFHVELDRHSILFSENLPSESYLDTGNRSFFQNGGAVIDLNVGFVGYRPVIDRDTHCCRPFVYAAGSVLPVWTRLAQRAAQLGHIAPEVETTQDPAPRITVNGREFRPIRAGDDLFSFILPSTATEVRLRSNAARPCDTQPWIEDRRVLGVSVSRIRVRHGSEIEDLALDGPALGRGWWAVERDGLQISRLTNGDAVLRLPEAHGPSRVLELKMGGNMTYPLGSTDSALDFVATARIA
jgi:hypothetical protein